jgi:hypothetical protein
LIIALKCPAAFAVIKLLLSISVRAHTHTHTHIYYRQHILCVLHHIRSWFPESVSFGGHKCRVFFVHRDRYSFWKQSFLRRSTQALALNGKFKTHVGRVSKAGPNTTWASTFEHIRKSHLVISRSMDITYVWWVNHEILLPISYLSKHWYPRWSGQV